MIIVEKAYPRVGLVGNPSDGYFGKTISFAFSNFCAEVTLYESPELEILPCIKDKSFFRGVRELVQDVERHGYYGGIRLLKATIKRFYDYCVEHDIDLNSKNFTIRYQSNIPHGVGLAGSSAIITACLRALMSFYGLSIPKPVQANLVLSAERDELNIPAGLQDRVIQVYEGLVYMDFDASLMKAQGCGRYEPLDPKSLPSLYVAYQEDLSETTEKFHNNIRDRFNRGEKSVVEAMRYWARLTDQVRRRLEQGDKDQIGPLLDANFDRRSEIYQIGSGNLRMIETARSLGTAAKFTGSGAIVGTYHGEKMFTALRKKLRDLKVKVIKPRIVHHRKGSRP